MKTTKLMISSAGLASLLCLGVSEAQEAKPLKSPRGGDQLQVDPAVQQKYEAQAKRQVVRPDLPLVEWEQDRTRPSRRVSGRVLSVGDQSVLVAVPITPEQKAVLSERWKTVTRVEDATHETILGDELCLRYPVALDYDTKRLTNKLGQVVELEVGTSQSKRPLVLFVRGS